MSKSAKTSIIVQEKNTNFSSTARGYTVRATG